MLAGCSGVQRFDTTLPDKSVNVTLMVYRTSILGAGVEAVTTYRCAPAKACDHEYTGLAADSGISPALLGTAAQLGAATLMPSTSVNIQGGSK